MSEPNYVKVDATKLNEAYHDLQRAVYAIKKVGNVKEVFDVAVKSLDELRCSIDGDSN